MPINTNIQFQIENKIVFIPSPLTSISNQDIFDTANDFLDGVNVTRIKNFVSAGGKEDLTVGQVGLTLTLIDWKVQFEDRAGPGITEVAVIGNLVGKVGSISGASQIVIEPSSNVFVRIVESTAPFVNSSEWTQLEKDQVTDLLEADMVFDKSAGLLHFYRKGTTTDLITPKDVTGEQVTGDVTIDQP